LSQLPEAALEDRSVISFKSSQAGVEQFALRDDDDVEARRDVVTTKNLSNQSLSAISRDRATQFSGGRNPQPAQLPIVGLDEQRSVAAMDARAVLVHLLELGAPANPGTAMESHGLPRQLSAKSG
jgi:hypothetical protein